MIDWGVCPWRLLRCPTMPWFTHPGTRRQVAHRWGAGAGGGGCGATRRRPLAGTAAPLRAGGGRCLGGWARWVDACEQVDKKPEGLRKTFFVVVVVISLPFWFRLFAQGTRQRTVDGPTVAGVRRRGVVGVVMGMGVMGVGRGVSVPMRRLQRVLRQRRQGRRRRGGGGRALARAVQRQQRAVVRAARCRRVVRLLRGGRARRAGRRCGRRLWCGGLAPAALLPVAGDSGRERALGGQRGGLCGHGAGGAFSLLGGQPLRLLLQLLLGGGCGGGKGGGGGWLEPVSGGGNHRLVFYLSLFDAPTASSGLSHARCSPLISYPHPPAAAAGSTTR
jgi:hypothetical protein